MKMGRIETGKSKDELIDVAVKLKAVLRVDGENIPEEAELSLMDETDIAIYLVDLESGFYQDDRYDNEGIKLIFDRAWGVKE